MIFLPSFVSKPANAPEASLLEAPHLTSNIPPMREQNSSLGWAVMSPALDAAIRGATTGSSMTTCSLSYHRLVRHRAHVLGESLAMRGSQGSGMRLVTTLCLSMVFLTWAALVLVLAGDELADDILGALPVAAQAALGLDAEDLPALTSPPSWYPNSWMSLSIADCECVSPTTIRKWHASLSPPLMLSILWLLWFVGGAAFRLRMRPPQPPSSDSFHENATGQQALRPVERVGACQATTTVPQCAPPTIAAKALAQACARFRMPR